MAITFSSPVITITTETTMTGTATSGGASTITDTGKTWTTNEHQYRGVTIVSGTGAGQCREIASNTATALTVTKAWTIQPDNTSVYRIVYDVLDVYTAGHISQVGTSKFQYDFTTRRLLLTSGGIFFSERYPAIFGAWADVQSAITVSSGAFLIIGTTLTRGRCIDFTKTLTTDPNANYLETWSAINIASGGTLNWQGGEIQAHSPISFMEGSIIRIASQNCKLTNEGLQTGYNGGTPQIRQRATNVEIDGITIFGYATTIIGNATRFDNPAISNTNSGVLPSSTSPSNTWLRFKGADLSDNIELPFWIYSSKWLRIINPWKDDFICKTNATTDAGNKGLNEVRRGVVCTLTSGSGAKVYVKDVNNGLRLGANLIGTNPDYTADREYTLTESGGTASYTTDGGLLVRVWYNRLGGATPVVNDKMDNRGITQLMKVEYGRQPSFATMPTTGVTDAKLSFSDLPDLGITQATKATVAGYTGISCSYATGTLTATVTSNHTWNEIYDYVKYWESENPSAVWSNSKKSFIETSNKLSYIYNNFVLVINGCTVTAGAGQVLPTSPTVGTSGFFEDASGAIKNNAGTLLYLTPLTNKSIVSLGTSVGIENAVFAYGNEAMGLMTYDTSLNLTRLVANASGVVNGYLEWKRNSIVHANCYSVAGYYGYVGEKVPRSLNGTPIVNEVTRLAVDAQVTKSRTDAGAITGVTFSATGVDMGDNTLADVYDYQQYKFWATTGYIYGTMLGCMEWCVNGKCLEKSGTTYTGRSSSTVYQNMGGGGSFSTGIVEVALADNPEWIFGTMTAKLLNGGDYNYASETFIGTIDFNNASGVAVTVEVPEGVSYTRSGSPLPTIIEPQVYQSVTVSGAVAGSRIQIYDTTHSTQLYEGTPTFPYTWTDSNPYASDRTIRVRVMYKNGATAKIWWENVVGVATLANPAITALVSQQDDTVYNTNAIDGSTVTGVSIIDGTLRVNVSTGTMTWQKLYAYETDWLFTSAGIIDEGRFTVAKDVANYLWYDFKIKNVTSPTVPLVVSGGYGVDGDTGASIDMIDTTGGTIIFAPDHVVSSVVTVSGGNVITGDISDITPTINAIKAKTDDIHQVETGRWKIDTATKKMIFYDTDGTTPLKEYDLKDENGNPTSSNPYERVPV